MRRVLLLLLALPAAGCAAPFAPGAALDAFESAPCGFRIEVPEGWNRTPIAGLGIFLFAEGAPATESIGVFIQNGSLDELRASLATDEPAQIADVLPDGRLSASGEDTLDGRPALRARFDGTDRQGAPAVVEWRGVAHGERVLHLMWSFPNASGPSQGLAAAVASFRLTEAPTPACGAPPSVAAKPEDDGWATFAHPEGWYTLRHPGNWTVTDLSGTGEAYELEPPRSGPEDEYSEALLVIVREVPAGMTLDDVVDEVLEHFEERGWEVVGVEESRLGGLDARTVRTREMRSVGLLDGVRVLALHDGRLHWLEAAHEPGLGDAFAAEVPRIAETYRFGA